MVDYKAMLEEEFEVGYFYVNQAQSLMNRC